MRDRLECGWLLGVRLTSSDPRSRVCRDSHRNQRHSRSGGGRLPHAHRWTYGTTRGKSGAGADVTGNLHRQQNAQAFPDRCAPLLEGRSGGAGAVGTRNRGRTTYDVAKKVRRLRPTPPRLRCDTPNRVGSRAIGHTGPPPLPAGQSAVDHQIMSGDVAGALAQEEHGGTHHLLHLRQAPHRRLGSEAFEHW